MNANSDPENPFACVVGNLLYFRVTGRPTRRRAADTTSESGLGMPRVLVIMLSVILSSFSLAVQASDGAEIPKNEIEVRGFSRGDPTVRAYFEKNITDNVSLNLSAFKTRGWDEITVGPTYYVTPEMSVGVGFGTSRYVANDENTKSSHMTTSAFWFWKTNTWEAEVLVERYSRDPAPWYQEGYVQKRINSSLSVGMFVKKDSGWGPRLSYAIDENTEVWVSPLVKRVGDGVAIVGVMVSF